MIKQPSRPSLSLSALTRRDRWRIGLALITLLGVAAALFLQSLHAARTSRAQDDALRQGWLQRGTLSSNAVDVNAVLARYAIRQGSNSASGAASNGAMNWKAASPAEARMSLLALDAAGVKLTSVKLARDGAGFAINAERAP